MRRVFKKKEGYTLVELLVVMSIMAILMAISFGGYVVMRRATYVKYLGNKLQSDVREAFIQSIAIRGIGGFDMNNGGACEGKSAKLVALKIPFSANFQEYYMVSYCEKIDGTGLLKTTRKIDPSESLGFHEGTALQGSYMDGYMVLVYSAPYGDFSDYYYSGTPSINDASDVEGDTSLTDGFDADLADTTKWARDINNHSWLSTAANPSIGAKTLRFSLSSNSSMYQDLNINASGGVDLPNL